ncbi:MAG: CapA family protein [Patescibacteria group bacterium]
MEKKNQRYALSCVLLAGASLAAMGLLTWYGFLAQPDRGPAPYALAPGAHASEKEPITLIAVGDIMLSRTVEKKMLQYGDWAYPFRETHILTESGDITFGNLECPLIEGSPVNPYEMSFRADPQSVEGLTLGGFDVVSLANNHVGNQGRPGIARTLEVLDAAGIAHAGAGLNAGEAALPAIVEASGYTVGYLAYTDGSFTSAGDRASEERAGVAFFDEDSLARDVAGLSAAVDIVVVSLHAGVEYEDTPREYQQDLARTAIDSGARVVIGHHPHVVQPIEEYGNGLILYSLGNFVFDQMWSDETTEGAVASVTLSEGGVLEYSITPVRIRDYAQPQVLSPEDGQHIIERMINFTF